MKPQINQSFRENRAIQIAKVAGKRIVFAIQGEDHVWNVFDPKDGYAMPVRSFQGACHIAAHWKEFMLQINLENHTVQAISKGFKSFVN